MEKGFQKGSLDQFEIQTKDVGFVYGIAIYIEKNEMWIPEKITVKRGGREESIFDPNGQIINCPLKCSLILMNKKPDDAGNGAFGGGIIGGFSNGAPMNNMLMNNDFMGAGLSPEEIKKLVTLTCEDVVKGNAKIGPKFANNQANFDWIIGRCPSNCLDDSTGKV